MGAVRVSDNFILIAEGISCEQIIRPYPCMGHAGRIGIMRHKYRKHQRHRNRLFEWNGFTGTLTTIQELQPNADVITGGLDVKQSKAAEVKQEDVDKWIDSLPDFQTP